MVDLCPSVCCSVQEAAPLEIVGPSDLGVDSPITELGKVHVCCRPSPECMAGKQRGEFVAGRGIVERPPRNAAGLGRLTRVAESVVGVLAVSNELDMRPVAEAVEQSNEVPVEGLRPEDAEERHRRAL